MSYRVKRDIKIPLRDEVLLSADHYQPEEQGVYPAIVVRTPYGKTREQQHLQGEYFTEHGYHVINVDVRGRGDSEGEFVPYRNDGVDGYDVIEWVANQTWCDGNVGTLGGSYLGRIQWLTALEQPPSLKAMVPLVTPSDPFVEWPTGLPNPMHICWLYMTRGRVMQNINLVDWQKVYWTLPYVDMDLPTGWYSEQWREEIEHPYFDDYWKHIAYQHRFDEIDVPVLNISGWYDDEQIGTPLNYQGMVEAGKSDQHLLMGPWPHQLNKSTKLGDLDFGEESLINMNDYQRSFFDYYLKGIDQGFTKKEPVEIFVMGENKWRQEKKWPLPNTKWTKFYLHSGGKANSRFGDGVLSTSDPAKSVADYDQYVYDPANPVPFITEMVSHQIGGPDDYSSIERRDDVLVYTSDVLEDDLEVTGPVKANLFVSTDAKDTDFTVKLLDVRKSGFAQRLTDGLVRGRFRNGTDKPELMTPGEVYEVEVDCWNTSHIFKKGHQIRIEIASSAFPKYDRNLNTGDELGKATEMKVANQTVYHSEQYPSSVVLPIIKR
ncbi:CocE/NonD family hydrolase [Alkalibacillus haloalkaliphilus]|uniref:Hydrolase n=1 Tax=Alkalibacillus haloalkaliphilus TaxID=94136 RepID=A0A511W0C5_9BACI|nr:CocE/NonD family hydrolase [Alkalibacillus haloalkaliphilus]GEN44544.1 hydrolase [Alkalibacillus haloalkaliphilus]